MNKRALATRLLVRSGLLHVARMAMPWSGVLSFNYHRIGSAANSPYDHGLWSADAEAFAWQVQFLKSQLDVITPDELPDALAQKRGRYGMITFDDGYRDNYETAFPILKLAGVKATFFVATGYIDNPSLPWWDEIAWLLRTSDRSRLDLSQWVDKPILFDEPLREQAVRTVLRCYKTLANEQTGAFLDAVAEACARPRCGPEHGRTLWMNWSMLREMRAAGMVIGGHTVHHPVLANLDARGQQREIGDCCQRLKSELGDLPESFSYPVGGRNSFNEITRQCLREAGIRYAASYYGGYRRFSDWDDLDIRRMAVETELSREWFRAAVSLPKWFTPLEPAAMGATTTGSDA